METVIQSLLMLTIPPPVTAAIIAVVGVAVSLWRQSVAARRQREFELRRDQLLNLAEKAAIPSAMFIKVLNSEVTIAEVESCVPDILGDLSKSSCVASLPTMKKAFDASRCFSTHWHEVLKDRIHLDWVLASLKNRPVRSVLNSFVTLSSAAVNGATAL